MTVNLDQKRSAYCQDLETSLAILKERLGEMPEVKKVILFGSYARGRRDLFTDLDLLVVMDSPLDFLQRTARLYQKLQVTVDMDLLVYTPLEFDRKREQGFLRHALETGQVIYEK